MFWRRLIIPVMICLCAFPLPAQEEVDLDIIMKIKQEEFQNSQIDEILGVLTDVYGQRITSSHTYLAACGWARDQLKAWDLSNAALESWGTFGRGWEVVRYSAGMVEPEYVNLIAYPKAWTISTNGTISGQPVLLDIRSEEDFEEYRGTLSGAIVIIPSDLEPENHFEPDASRYTAAELAELAQAPEPQPPRPRGNRGGVSSQRRLQQQVQQFMRDEGVGVILEGSRRDYGTVLVGRGGSHTMGSTGALPTLAVSSEQFLRINRLLQREIEVRLEISSQTQFVDDDSLGYNVIAEIPGTDRRLRNELVMLGGHLDSWHGGTGAADNAAGVAVTMEAVRILKAIGVEPRRTIRIALWGGEEQGLLGSRGYVAKHFGDRNTMELKAEHKLLSAYYNLDNGSGRIRGIYLQGNDAVRPVFEAYLAPFHDMGATTVTIRNTSGTDHLAFDAVGLSGFQFIQDPLDYSTRLHHTNMDVYEHVDESDLMQAAVIMASFVYHTAMRDERLPRKPLPEPRE
ncbi:M20/M25/M40 family metallo-hydrolase [Candidatus Neomarinimicrobiota bacterium]